MRIRSLFLRSLSFVFLTAFASFYVQFPGLLSSSGLEPVDRVLPIAFPWINEHIIQSNFFLTKWVDSADSLCKLVSITGIIFSASVVMYVDRMIQGVSFGMNLIGL